jgi:uncharacterized Zn-binding protein involved in type VI secretion
MGRPAAQAGVSLHICPISVPPTPPHVGGPILPPGIPNVLIGGVPAAVQGNLCVCVGPPDSILMGSLGVKIGGMPAARVLEPTAHGGQISVGFPLVKIGDINVVAAATIWAGQQNYGNCGVQSSEQLIHQATGVSVEEGTILQIAIDNGWAVDSNDMSSKGGTSTTDRQSILAHYGVDSTIVPTTAQAVSDALVKRQGIIAHADAGGLWGDEQYLGGSHAVIVTDGEWDENGNLTHVYTNDTGNGTHGEAMPIDDFILASDADGGELNVTKDPIWTEVR